MKYEENTERGIWKNKRRLEEPEFAVEVFNLTDISSETRNIGLYC